MLLHNFEPLALKPTHYQYCTMYPPQVNISNFNQGRESMELRVGGKYRLGRKIGSGSFGDIYLGKLDSNILLVLKKAQYLQYLCLILFHVL